MWKSNVGDFKISRIPCEHWWVRYGVFCQKLSDAQNILSESIDLKKKNGKIEIVKNENGHDVIRSFQGNCIKRKDKINVKYLELKKKEIVKHEYKNIPIHDLFSCNCPYIEDQLQCREYSPGEGYKGKTMKEIKKCKGYDV